MIPFDVTRRCRNPRWRSVSPRFKVDTYRDIVKDNKRNQILYRPRDYSLRKVPAFTIQTEQFCTRPFTPKKASKQHSNDAENLEKFLRLYEDRKFPVRVIDVGGSKPRAIEWNIDPNQLSPTDSRELLRRFAVGLPLEKQPYSLIAVNGLQDMLNTPQGPQILAESLTDVIPNIRKGLNARSLWKRKEMLQLVRRMAEITGIGQLLLPYYRMLLPPLRVGRNTRVTTDISTDQRDKYIEEIEKTLAVLERTGGDNAFLNIKYIIPDYTSQDV